MQFQIHHHCGIQSQQQDGLLQLNRQLPWLLRGRIHTRHRYQFQPIPVRDRFHLQFQHLQVRQVATGRLLHNRHSLYKRKFRVIQEHLHKLFQIGWKAIRHRALHSRNQVFLRPGHPMLKKHSCLQHRQ